MPAICPPDKDRDESPCKDPEAVDDGAMLEVLEGSADEEDVVALAFGLRVKPQMVASVIAVPSAIVTSSPAAEPRSPGAQEGQQAFLSLTRVAAVVGATPRAETAQLCRRSPKAAVPLV
jgi:hypothetical protein